MVAAPLERANGVIYFPYINVPATEWFTRTLLYWDEVGCIIPPDYDPRAQRGHTDGRMRPDGRTPEERYGYTAALINAGLIRPITPELPGEATALFVTRFLARLDAAGMPPWEPTGDESERISVHRGKMGAWLLSELRSRQLASVTDRSQWVSVEPRTATMFMASLAAFLGDIASDPLRPATDDAASLSALREVASPIAIATHGEIRDVLLEGVLPAPSAAQIDPHDLMNFKERYARQLSSFRRRVEKGVRSLALVSDPNARGIEANELRMDFEEEIEELSRRMQEHGWRSIARTAIESLAVLTPAGLLAPSHPLEAAAGAAVGLGAVAFELLRPSGTSLNDDPLAYALKAQSHWASGRPR